MDTFGVQIEPDDLRQISSEGHEVIVVPGRPAVAGMVVGEQAAVDYAIFNSLAGLDLQNPQLQRAVAGILGKQPRQPTVVKQVI